MTRYINKKQAVKNNWWLQEEPNSSIHSIVASIENNERFRQDSYVQSARLYGNKDIHSLSPTDYDRTNDTQTDGSRRLTLNIIKSVVDALRSRISDQRPRANFQTANGDYSLQKRAKNLTLYMDGLFDKLKVYPKAQLAFLHACLFGTGFIKLGIVDEEIVCDVVFPWEIVVPMDEAIYGEPRQLHQKKFIHRDVLTAMFPDKEKEITAAAPAKMNSRSYAESNSIILVIESWHLQSSKDSKDGKHCITLENCTLVSEEYEDSDFPFVMLRYDVPPMGYFGVSLTNELTGLQLQINKTLRLIQRSQEAISVPRFLIDSATQIKAESINNEIGSIIRYTGKEPSVKTFTAVNPEVNVHLSFMIQQAYNIAGVSELAAQAKKPSGLNSGAALREFNDQQSQRFSLTNQSYETFFLDIANKLTLISAELYKGKKNVQVTLKSNKFIDKIDWKDIEIEKDSYNIRAFPTSILPSTPAGKMQMVTELVQNGFLDKDSALALLDFPDVDGYMNLANAPLDNIMATMENIIEKGVYVHPQPWENLQLSLKVASLTYQRANLNNVEPDRLELIQRYMDEVLGLINPQPEPQPEMLPQPPAAGPVGPVDPMLQGAPVDPMLDPMLAAAGPAGPVDPMLAADPNQALAPIANPIAAPQGDLLPI